MTQIEFIKLMKKGITDGQYPQNLYKYRADKAYTANIITNNELWFENPSNFNDPYDCNIPINVSNSTLQDIQTYLNGIVVSSTTDIGQLAVELKNDPRHVEKKVKEALSHLGVCCFSSKYNSILQWSHYADYHKGICFNFDTLELIKSLGDFFIPLPVKYQKELPKYNHFRDSSSIAEIIVKPKWKGWKYEKEIRIVKQGIIQSNDIEDIIKKKRTVTFESNALKEIIFGVNTPQATIDKYKKLCADNNKTDVKFFKMELGKGQYYQLNKRTLK